MKFRVVDDERGFYLVGTECQPAAGCSVRSISRLLKKDLGLKHDDIIEIKKL